MLLLLELDLNKPFKCRVEKKGRQGVLPERVFRRKQLQTCGDLHWRASAYLEFTTVSLGMLQSMCFNYSSRVGLSWVAVHCVSKEEYNLG